MFGIIFRNMEIGRLYIAGIIHIAQYPHLEMAFKCLERVQPFLEKISK